MSESTFYTKVASYWANVPATINGVLGGFGHISDIDINGSKTFLNEILTLESPPGRKLALDCGAGIGRVSKNLLIHQFEKVDLVEQNEKFINTAKQLIGDDNVNLGTVYKIGLQHFHPHKKYDVIWCQWVLGHLKDNDVIDFLVRCSNALATDGMIIIKENITPSNEIEYDEDDFSVTRPYELMKLIFNATKLKLVKTAVQTDFPEEIYPVHMFALAPIIDNYIENTEIHMYMPN